MFSRSKSIQLTDFENLLNSLKNELRLWTNWIFKKRHSYSSLDSEYKEEMGNVSYTLGENVELSERKWRIVKYWLRRKSHCVAGIPRRVSNNSLLHCFCIVQHLCSVTTKASFLDNQYYWLGCTLLCHQMIFFLNHRKFFLMQPKLDYA